MNQPQFIAYSDESNYNEGRYRGIALVSLRASNENSLEEGVLEILHESNIKEFKWHKLRSARERLAAIKLVKYAIEKTSQKIIRIDVLTWDIQDSRHNIQKRDDISNLQRMYYHLFKNVLNKRWSSNSLWTLKPDEHSAIDWHNIERILGNSSNNERLINFDSDDFSINVVREFHINKIMELSSDKAPLIQLADLFVGLDVYSRNCYYSYSQWEDLNSKQLSLFPSNANIKFSNADKERFPVLSELKNLCEKSQLNVSIKTGLKTFNPSKPLNFWWYEPQTHKDKAPVKNSGVAPARDDV